ncbi:hypothetical protein C8R43DRAFT_919699 [Mycena crocata]|nr:hypothetical protein C8R43DRAFT_919699 [Mycena crocata]
MNLDHLLVTNDAPTDFQLAAAFSLLEEMEIDLALINTRRERLIEVIRAHKSVVSRLRSLPPEVLSLIFLAVPPDDECGLMFRTPWLLTTICHRWRAVALATPALWTATHFMLEEWQSSGRQKLLRTSLERSGSGPLHMNISASSAVLSNVSFDLLISSSQRWRDAKLRIPMALYSRMSALGIGLPALRKLELELEPNIVGESLDGVLGFVESASLLRTLDLTRDFVSIAPPFPPFCFNSITSFHGRALEESSAIFLLHEMPVLEDCTITIRNFVFSERPQDLPRLELPHLRSLAIDLLQFHREDPPMLKLRTPILSALRVGGSIHAGDVLGMLCPSPALLTTLTIDTWDSLDDMRTLLRELHALVELKLGQQPTPTIFITMLDPSSGASLSPALQSPLLPCLQRLTLAGTHFDFVSFVKMLTARSTCPDTQTLSFVAIEDRKYLGTSQARPLRELCAAGLQIRFTDKRGNVLPLCTSDEVLKRCSNAPRFGYGFEDDDLVSLDSDSDIDFDYIYA